MVSLRALDMPLGPGLVDAIIRCRDAGIAFCVLDQRLSPVRARQELDLLGATEVEDPTGQRVVLGGAGVDIGTGLVMLTSGSSGTPKAAQLSWEALTASATLTNSVLSRSQSAVWYPCLPPNHIGGLAVLLRHILAGAGLVWGLPDDVARGPSYGATHVAVVRTQLARYDLSGYDTILLGGARPPQDMPNTVVTTWGMTETGSGIVYDGRPLPGVEVAEVNGELCVRTPTLFSRYRDRDRPRVTGPDGASDWFPTGDAGVVVDGVVRVFGSILKECLSYTSCISDDLEITFTFDGK